MTTPGTRRTTGRRRGLTPRVPPAQVRVRSVGTSITAVLIDRDGDACPRRRHRQARVGGDDFAPVVEAGAERDHRPIALRGDDDRIPAGIGTEDDSLRPGHERRRAPFLDVLEPDEPCHPRVGRAGPELLRARDLEDPAGAHHGDAAAERECLRHVVGHVDGGLVDLGEERPELGRRVGRAADGRAHRAARRVAARVVPGRARAQAPRACALRPRATQRPDARVPRARRARAAP